MNYYIEDNKIRLIRFEVSYKLKSENFGNVSKVEQKKYFSIKDEVDEYISQLDAEGIDYTLETYSTEEYEFLEGMEVESKEAADKLIYSDISEMIEDKVSEFVAECRDVIYKGIEYTLTNGETKMFSFNAEDQININALKQQMEAGEYKEEVGVPYHANGELCQFFSFEDFSGLVKELTDFKFYHTTCCNHLMLHLKNMTSREGIYKLRYGTELEDKYLESFNKLLGIMKIR